jgi:hypothetical protein
MRKSRIKQIKPPLPALLMESYEKMLCESEGTAERGVYSGVRVPPGYCCLRLWWLPNARRSQLSAQEQPPCHIAARDSGSVMRAEINR